MSNEKIERAGQLQEGDFINEISDEYDRISRLPDRNWQSMGHIMVTAQLNVMRRRSLVSDIGLEVLKDYR